MSDIKIPENCWDDDSQGAISAWYYSDGELVNQGDVVCEVMNEKVASEITAPQTGKLEIFINAEVPVSKGETIAKIVN